MSKKIYSSLKDGKRDNGDGHISNEQHLHLQNVRIDLNLILLKIFMTIILKRMYYYWLIHKIYFYVFKILWFRSMSLF